VLQLPSYLKVADGRKAKEALVWDSQATPEFPLRAELQLEHLGHDAEKAVGLQTGYSGLPWRLRNLAVLDMGHPGQTGAKKQLLQFEHCFI